MEKIIEIDRNARIKIIHGSMMLQFKKKSRTNRIAWITGGHFSDWASMAEYYITSAPYRTIEGTAQMERLIEVVRRSTDQISRILKNN
jgi:hypothetical protein